MNHLRVESCLRCYLNEMELNKLRDAFRKLAVEVERLNNEVVLLNYSKEENKNIAVRNGTGIL